MGNNNRYDISWFNILLKCLNIKIKPTKFNIIQAEKPCNKNHQTECGLDQNSIIIKRGAIKPIMVSSIIIMLSVNVVWYFILVGLGEINRINHLQPSAILNIVPTTSLIKTYIIWILLSLMSLISFTSWFMIFKIQKIIDIIQESKKRI